MGEEEESTESEEEEGEVCKISVHALAGQMVAETIKLIGKVKGNCINILVDTGSTHSFLDIAAAKKLRCQLEQTAPLMVTVADGGKMRCNSRCSNFQWTMHDKSYTADVRIISLGGCDMIVGVDWLKRLGKVTFDFDKHIITYNHL